MGNEHNSIETGSPMFFPSKWLRGPLEWYKGYDGRLIAIIRKCQEPKHIFGKYQEQKG